MLRRKDRLEKRAQANLTTTRTEAPFASYIDDPVRFIREALGEELPPDLVDVAESLRDYDTTVVRSCNGPGKTWLAARLAIWFVLSHWRAKVYISAAPPLSNLESNLWGEISAVIEAHPKIFKGCAISYLKIRVAANWFLMGVTIPVSANPKQVENAFAGKHAPNLLFVVDEGDGVPKPVYDGIESCKSGGQRVRLLDLFNPREESGPLYEMEAEERAHVIELSAFRHPNVLTGEQIYPGAVDRATTVRRIIEWTRPLNSGEQPDGECFEVPDFLAGCTALSASGREYPPLVGGWRHIEDLRFCYMVLGQYSARGSERNIFNKAYLAGLERELMRRNDDGQLVHAPIQTIFPGTGRLHGTLEIYRQPKPGELFVLGADVAKGLVKDGSKLFDLDYSTMGIFSLDLEQVGSYYGREGCTPGDFGRDLAAVGCHFNEALIVVEKNGPGVATLEELVYRQKYRKVYYRAPNPKLTGVRNSEDEKWGFWTDPETKDLVDTALADAINEAATEIGTLQLRSLRSVREAKLYGHLENAKRGAMAGHDDHVRCDGLAVYVIRTDPPQSTRKLAPREPDAYTGAKW